VDAIQVDVAYSPAAPGDKAVRLDLQDPGDGRYQLGADSFV
jgi:hypothetical protein